MTGVDLAAEVVAQLAGHANIVGIKESSADLEKVASLTRVLPESFQVLVGSSAKFHDCLALGAIGGILAAANALPEATLPVHHLYRAGAVAVSEGAGGHRTRGRRRATLWHSRLEVWDGFEGLLRRPRAAAAPRARRPAEVRDRGAVPRNLEKKMGRR